jgi:hypothetical protein
MAGLVPAIHGFLLFLRFLIAGKKEVVDGRHKAGHDVEKA